MTETRHHARGVPTVGWYAIAGVVVGVAVLLGAMIGPAGPTWWRVPLALLDHLPLISIDSGVTENEWNVVWQVRMPRVVLAGIVGGMLSLAGAGYQGVQWAVVAECAQAFGRVMNLAVGDHDGAGIALRRNVGQDGIQGFEGARALLLLAFGRLHGDGTDLRLTQFRDGV